MKKGILAATLLFSVALIAGVGANTPPQGMIPKDLTVIRTEVDDVTKTVTSYNKNGEEVGKMWIE